MFVLGLGFVLVFVLGFVLGFVLVLVLGFVLGLGLVLDIRHLVRGVRHQNFHNTRTVMVLFAEGLESQCALFAQDLGTLPLRWFVIGL